MLRQGSFDERRTGFDELRRASGWTDRSEDVRQAAASWLLGRPGAGYSTSAQRPAVGCWAGPGPAIRRPPSGRLLAARPARGRLFDVRQAAVEGGVGEFVGAGVLFAGDVADADDVESIEEGAELGVERFEGGVFDSIAALQLAHDEF